MKRKDLVVGLDVAVKDGCSICRAYILELDTQWAWTYFAGYHESSKRLTGQVAVVELNPDGTWRPSVVKCSQILMSWSDYEAQQQRERDERSIRDREQTRQRDAYEKLRSRCAELLKITVQSSRLGVAEVQLNDLYAVACVMEKLQKME